MRSSASTGSRTWTSCAPSTSSSSWICWAPPSRIFALSLADLARLLGRKLDDGALASRRHPGLRGEDRGGLDCRRASKASFTGIRRTRRSSARSSIPPLTLFLRGALPDNGFAACRDRRNAFPDRRRPQGGLAARVRTAAGRGSASCRVSRGASTGRRTKGAPRRGADRWPCSATASTTSTPRPAGRRQRPFSTGGAASSASIPRACRRCGTTSPRATGIISGLCRAVVVVAGPGQRSGALITAEYALDQGRDLYVHAAGSAEARGQARGGWPTPALR